MAEAEILSEREVEQVIMAVLYGRGEGSATEEELKQAVAWAEEARIDAACLENVLSGRMWLDVRNGEMVFMASEKK